MAQNILKVKNKQDKEQPEIGSGVGVETGKYHIPL